MGMPDKLPRLIGTQDHQIHSQQLPAKAITGVAAVAKKASDDDPMLAEELQKNVFMLLLGDIHDLLSSAGAIAPPKWPPIRNGGKLGEKTYGFREILCSKPKQQRSKARILRKRGKAFQGPQLWSSFAFSSIKG